MHRDYFQKIRKSLSSCVQLVPIKFESFYSLLKECCDSIPSSSITPEILGQLSNIYAYIKDQIELGFPCSEEGDNKLNSFVDEFKKYLPKKKISELILEHFEDEEFYAIIKAELTKAETFLHTLTSGDATPMLKPLCLAKMVQNQGKKSSNGQSLHINGNNELSICFWLNSFKFDYAVHFDVFWNVLQKYLNSTLSKLANNKKGNDFYPYFIPNPSQQSVRNRIRREVDPDNKYYITSANCNDLFIKLSEPEFLHNLSELSTLKFDKESYWESAESLKIIYRNRNKEGDESSFVDSCSIFVNDFSTFNGEKGMEAQEELSNESVIEINGNCLTVGGRIFRNKYPPTIRFGLLADNEICLKNKYVSRRQFMIIEELEEKERVYENSMEESREIYDSFDPKAVSRPLKIEDYRSQYYLVCLSPSNYTSVIFGERVEATQGLIFKIRNVFIQIMRVANNLKGILVQNKEADKELDRQNSLESEDNETIQSGHMLTLPLSNSMDSSHETIEKTLENLPTKIENFMIQKTVECKFLSGELNGKKMIISSEKPMIETKINNKNEVFSFEMESETFYIPSGTEIVVKKANQALSGYLSDKVKLKKGMKILLENVEIEIFE